MVAQIWLVARTWSKRYFSFSNRTSLEQMAIIRHSAQIWTRGIQPHTIPMIRHLIPNWTEVVYTRMMPFQNRTDSIRMKRNKVQRYLTTCAKPPEVSCLRNKKYNRRNKDCVIVVARNSCSRVTPSSKNWFRLVEVLRAVRPGKMLI